jgi:nucleoside diphosphate kinase
VRQIIPTFHLYLFSFLPLYSCASLISSTELWCALVLEGEDAIEKNREIMGATYPAKAESGTLRALYASTMTQNAVHGSDAPKSAAREVAFFFPKLEIF